MTRGPRTVARNFGLTLTADVVLITLILYGTNFVRFGADWPADGSLFVASFSVATFLTVVILYFSGLYERSTYLAHRGIAARITKSMVLVGGTIALVTLGSSGFFREFSFATDRGLPFPFINLAMFFFLGVIGLTFSRSIVGKFGLWRDGEPQVVLVGDPDDLLSAREQFVSARAKFEVVDTVSQLDQLSRTLQSQIVTDVLLLSPAWLEDGAHELVHQLDDNGVNVFLRVRGVDTMLGLRTLSEISGLPFIQLRPSALPLPSAHLKRILDLTLLVVFSPVWFLFFVVGSLYQLVAIGRPIFYIQRRVGLRNKLFPMVKFRTMRLNAEHSSGAVLSAKDDDRVIPACRWLRSTRFDELPQLFNVLAGHMSIVGPRPERPELIATFAGGLDGYDRRHALRPGVTGLAQIYGRYDTKPQYKLGYDLHYAVNWSILLDLEILMKTISVVLLRRV